MRRFKFALMAALCAVMALAPSLAEARAGNSRSFGSRGSMGERYTPQRSPYGYNQPTYNQPRYIPQPSYRPTPYGVGSGVGRPFVSGLMGGLLGAGLAGMLFGHGMYPVGGSPFGLGLGLLLQFALIGLLIYAGMRFLRRR